MAHEIEAKIRLSDEEAFGLIAHLDRKTIEVAYARYEVNIMFDCKGKLDKSGKSLRLRSCRDLLYGGIKHYITSKGPQLAGQKYKARPEHEIIVSSDGEARGILGELGYSQVFLYEKVRYAWHYGMSTIEVDELPHIGIFVEIEGTESCIEHACRAFNLDTKKTIKKGYPTLIANTFAARDIDSATARFSHEEWRLKKVMQKYIQNVKESTNC